MKIYEKSVDESVTRITSDNDRTGGLTQSSQHLHSKVNRTNGGEIPSHCVLNCN
jgi:hypothetical protein